MHDTITFIFLCTRLNDTYETTQMHIHIKTFTVCLCDKYNFHELDRLFCSYTCHVAHSQNGRTYGMGAQWLSGRVLDSRPKGRGFEPHRRHCVVPLEQDTFILA